MQSCFYTNIQKWTSLLSFPTLRISTPRKNGTNSLSSVQLTFVHHKWFVMLKLSQLVQTSMTCKPSQLVCKLNHPQVRVVSTGHQTPSCHLPRQKQIVSRSWMSWPTLPTIPVAISSTSIRLAPGLRTRVPPLQDGASHYVCGMNQIIYMLRVS